MQREVAKIMAKLKRTHKKRKNQKKEIHNKLVEIKELHEECSTFKLQALDKIDEANSEFRAYKQEVS